MKSFAFASLLVLSVSLAACGGEDPSATDAGQTAAAQTGEASGEGALPALSGPHVWTVDYARSSIAFTAEQEGTSFTGTFGTFEAAIRLDPDEPQEGHIEAVIDLASVDAGSSDRNEALPTGDWFATRRHPTARFVSDEIRRAGTEAYEAIGALTLKGVTREVVLPFTLVIDGDSAQAEGALTLDRTEFNVGTGAYADGDWVTKSVTVTVDIAATR